jgi:hypothetical protein
MGALLSKKPRSGRHTKPFQPAIGTDFPVEDADAVTRDFLARFIMIFAGTAVAGAGVYSLTTADHGPLIAVWSVAAPFIGGLATYYFGPRRNNTG